MEFQDVSPSLLGLAGFCLTPFQGIFQEVDVSGQPLSSFVAGIMNSVYSRDFVFLREAAVTRSRFIATISAVPDAARAWDRLPTRSKLSILAHQPVAAELLTDAAVVNERFIMPILDDALGLVAGHVNSPSAAFYPMAPDAVEASVYPSETSFTAGRIAAIDGGQGSGAHFELGFILESLLQLRIGEIGPVATLCPDRIPVKGVLLLWSLLQRLFDAAAVFLWVRGISRRLTAAVDVDWTDTHAAILVSLRWM